MSETHNVVSLDGWSTCEAFTRWLALGDRRSLPNHMTLKRACGYVCRYEAELDHLDAVFPVAYTKSLTTPAPFNARQNAASPVVGRLIVRTSTVLKSVFKERAAGMPSSSHLHESLVALMLAQSWPPSDERSSH